MRIGRSRAVFTLFVVTGLALFGLLLAEMRVIWWELDRLSQGAKDNVLWGTYQIEPDLQDLMIALQVYGAPDPQISHDEVMERFDVFWSRIRMYDRGSMMNIVDAVPGGRAVIEDAKKALAEMEAEVLALKESPNRDKAFELANRLLAHKMAINDLGLSIFHRLNARALSERQSLVNRFQVYFLTTLAIILCSVVIIGMGIMENRHARRAEEERRQALEEAQRANRAKSDFLANMSHELRTPLNSILGFSEMMRDQVFGPLGHENYQDYVVNINESGAHLLAIINDILDLAKIEAETLTIMETKAILPRVVGSAIDMVRQGYREHERQFELSLPDDLPLLYCDENAIRRIFINMLSNAVKFSAPDTPVSIRAKIDADGSLRFWIQDHGIGISQENLERAMQPFQYVESVFSRKFDGAGLGLPISRALMEIHDGTLELDSQPGRGTTVNLWFPASRVCA